MISRSPLLNRSTALILIIVATWLAIMPQLAAAAELSDDELWAAIEKQTNTFSSISTLSVFPSGRNEQIFFVRASNGRLYIIDTRDDLVFAAHYAWPEKARRKQAAYRAEFAFVVKRTVQDAIENHATELNAKMIEILRSKVASIPSKTISERPEPTLEGYIVSYEPLRGKHNFPGYLNATAKVKIGSDIHKLTTPLQYYSLPNMRVVKK